MAARDGRHRRIGLVLPNSVNRPIVTKRGESSIGLCTEITQDGDTPFRHAQMLRIAYNPGGRSQNDLASGGDGQSHLRRARIETYVDRITLHAQPLLLLIEA